MITREKKFKLKVSSEISSLVPYPPGKPIEELERELGIKGSIKLASNENPLGPSKKALQAIGREIANLHRYPDGSCFYLKEKLSSRLGVSGDELIFGNGSNEIIELLIRTYLKAGDEAMMGDPSFAVYPLAVQAAGGRAVTVPLTKDFRHDLVKMAKAVTKKTRLVFIANPNNPTGSIVTRGEFRAFMDKMPPEVIVCVDEAYIEFVENAEFPKTLDFVKEGRAVVALRTFSKIYGLAGLRVGYGVADKEIIGYMHRVRQPFNVNSLAQAGAIAALDDDEHLQKTLKNNREGKKYLFAELSALGYPCVPTHANFFLVNVGDGPAVYQSLLKKGVIVRPMASYNMPGYIRVTIGMPEENRRFVAAFARIVKTGRQYRAR
ncbi:MAG: histidinol-phosphate transaminase [Deltaproteobacteria bacterium]|nr:histidinol-phosphate transaminase [Deltaproteobacteria bacterium]